MRRLNVFNFITLNGYYKGPAGDISWHQHSPDEEHDHAVNSMKPGGVLLFGRVTYEMMAGYWPSPMAKQNDPLIAEGMNKAEKIVFSRKLKKATWEPTRIIKSNLVDEVRKLKESPGKDMTMLGSGSIVAQLADHNLIDSYQLMLNPVAIGKGTPIFDSIKTKLNLKLKEHQVFKSGVVLLTYEPA